MQVSCFSLRTATARLGFGIGLSRCNVGWVFFRNRVERPAIGEESRTGARECLPAPHRHIDIKRAQFDRETNPASRLGCNQGGAAAQKRVIDRLPPIAVVQ